MKGRESEARQAAWRRGEQRLTERGMGAEEPRDSTDSARSGAMGMFAALAENVRDYAVFLMSPDGTIIYWGEGARIMKWWSRHQAEGGHLRMLYPDGGSEDGTAEEHLRQAVERGEYTGEGQRVRNDGSTFWAGVTLTALMDPGGSLLGFVKVTRDLTTVRAGEAARKAAHEAAEEANRSRSEYLTTLSHEIRTPIHAIMGYADLLDLETAGSLTEQQRSQVDRIRSSGQHLLGLANDVLDLSRLAADRMPVSAASARLGPAVEGAIGLVEPQAGAKGVSVVNRVSGFAAETAYWGDEERVRQVLVNLLGNAVKFTPSGGWVTVSAGTAQYASPDAKLEGPGPWAWVRVEDTGPGIPGERMAAIFEPFEQVDSSRPGQQGGSGLGITISRRLARRMGGDLTARSELGHGAAFFLWMPAAPGSEPPHPGSAE